MQYVAHQTTLQAEEVEILLVKGKHQSDDTKHPQIPMDELQILKGQETVAGLKAGCSSRRDHLVSVILAGWQSSTLILVDHVYKTTLLISWLFGFADTSLSAEGDDQKLMFRLQWKKKKRLPSHLYFFNF